MASKASKPIRTKDETPGMATINPQIDLSTDYAVTPDAISRYQADGHVLLRGVATPGEAAHYREAINAAVERLNPEDRPMEDRDTYGKAFLQTMNLWVHDDTVKEFVFARRFARAAAGLMGVAAVRLYHDQALYKEPGGGHTPWHQDQYYWPLSTPNAITMWMPLVDITLDMGIMSFASGSQVEGYIAALAISDESEELFKAYVTEQGYPSSQPQPMRAGDATFHNGWVLHNAPGNSTDRMREVMTVIYFADGTFVCEPNNPGRENDLKTWLPGCLPGDLAVSAINPLLYRAP